MNKILVDIQCIVISLLSTFWNLLGVWFIGFYASLVTSWTDLLWIYWFWCL
jgi:hypothetical protein